MMTNGIPRDRRPGPALAAPRLIAVACRLARIRLVAWVRLLASARLAAVACLLAAFTSGAAGDAAASPAGTRAAGHPRARDAGRQQAPSVRQAGLLPPSIVLFEDQDGTNVEPIPDADGSAAAAQAVSAAVVAEMAARKIDLTVVGSDEIGPADLSPLYGIPGRIARGDARPFPEAALSVEYPPGSVARAMERHRLEAVWIITGVAILSRGSAGTSDPGTPPTEAPASEPVPGKRLLLRAALVDVKGTVLFSDLVDEGGMAREQRLPGSPGESIPARADLRDPQNARHQVGLLLAEYRTEDDKREAEQAAALALEVKTAEPRSPHPAEFRLGLGVFFFGGGVDLWGGFLPKNSRWQFGYRYVRWTDTFDDPFAGWELTETTETMQGLQINYLFRPEKRGSWYLGASILQWSRTETATMNGVSDSESVVAPFFGGGYTRRPGKHFYFNTAIFLSPGTTLETDTGVSSEETSGGFDIQLQLGATF